MVGGGRGEGGGAFPSDTFYLKILEKNTSLREANSGWVGGGTFQSVPHLTTFSLYVGTVGSHVNCISVVTSGVVNVPVSQTNCPSHRKQPGITNNISRLLCAH